MTQLSGGTAANRRRSAIVRFLAGVVGALAVAAPACAVTPFPDGFHAAEIATNGTTLHVRVGGHGPAVVLLHGFGDTGDMWAPKVEQVEALKVEAAYFVDCILNNRTPFNDGHAGLRIVRMLEAADESLKQKGKIIQL